MTTTVNTSFQGLMKSIGRSSYPLAPIYEAITNSLEAIFQQQFFDDEQPLIDIKFNYAGLSDEMKVLESIVIEDNGAGFSDENYSRFRTLLDDSKGYNNRGSGRIQFLHRFQRIEVESYYLEDKVKYVRRFSCDASKFIFGHEEDECRKKVNVGTRVTLIADQSNATKAAEYDQLSLNDVATDIKQHFLLRFYLDVEKESFTPPILTLSFNFKGEEVESVVIDPKAMPSPDARGKIEVSYVTLQESDDGEIEWLPIKDKKEVLEWAHFKVPESAISKNTICLCSKDIPVEYLGFSEIKRAEPIDGHKYLTAFYGEFLDRSENVSHSVDKFNLPEKKDVENSIKDDLFFDKDREFLFFDDIKEEVDKALPEIYSDVIELKEGKKASVEAIAQAHGISYEAVQNIKINVSDSESVITDKLYKAQASILSKRNQKIKKTYDSLNNLDPRSEEYQKELQQKSSDLLALIPQQNKEELSRYVIRRNMVAHVLKLIIDQDLNYQREARDSGARLDKEGLFHDLIIKRKTQQKAGSSGNDLWILNEEFAHFDACSELPIKQIENAQGEKLLRDISPEEIEEYGLNADRRPDIFLYEEEGKCILIELKEPNTDLSDHLNQLTKYVNLIANYSRKKIEKFHCYLVGEKFNEIDLPNDYYESLTGDYVRSEIPVRNVKNREEKLATMQMEIVRLSSIYQRAVRRNKSFSDHLEI